ncbi:MAG: hypothetical protein IJJ25_10135 [Lachnospiraceae bacterium]|nr:hypothetical protein [Lachnospiraceae bacterium]
MAYNTTFLDNTKLIKVYYNPFDGELHSRDGIIKNGSSPRLTNDEIVSMRWLNENVIGTIPPLEELTDSARQAVMMNGIKGITQ